MMGFKAYLTNQYGIVVWTPGFEAVVPGSNPSDSFYFFGQNSQTLRAYNSFSQKFAKMGPFPLKNRGSRVSVDMVKSRAPCRPHCET